jgi:hypothetical protein
MQRYKNRLAKENLFNKRSIKIMCSPIKKSTTHKTPQKRVKFLLLGKKKNYFNKLDSNSTPKDFYLIFA